MLEQFEQAVSPGKRSTLIADLMREWLDKQRRKQLRRDIIEGCREMADVMLAIEREFNPLDEEVHRALDNPSETRRRGARAAQSRRRV